MAKTGKGCPVLSAAIRKYGAAAFKIELLATASTNEELNSLEMQAIAEHQSNDLSRGYNLTLGGESNFGFHQSEKQKALMRARIGIKHPMFGKHQSEEAKQAISEHTQGADNHFFGKKHTLASRQRMGARGEDHSNFGKHLSDSTRRKIQAANSRTFVLRSPEGKTVSITNLKGFCAGRGLSASHMSSVFHGGRNSHKGWTRGGEGVNPLVLTF
jgi:group I intron endonuclease